MLTAHSLEQSQTDIGGVMSNFYAELERGFAANAGGEALRFQDGSSWRYGQLLRRVEQIGQVLVDHEVSPGDRVMAQVEKSADNLALYLATLKVGAIFVPLNTAYTEAEKQYFIEDAKPRLFVGETHACASLTLNPDGTGSLAEQADTVVAAALPTVPRAAHDLAAILYTSGTTGRSKGAMLSHQNLASNAHNLCTAWGWQPDDVLLNALPIFHVHGLFIASHCALLQATPMIFLPKFDQEHVFAALAESTVLMGVPTFYTRLLQHPDLTPDYVSHMRVFICGSAPLTEPTFAAWKTRTGHRILERYGMSETIINTTNPLVGDRVPGTVGYALPGQEARITNAAGEVLPFGDVGNIEVRGPNVFQGYWQMPDKTAEDMRSDGFFITGDLGLQESDGRISIVGRAKDLVISGGYNVYPKEVERLLDELPEVQESAVIGVPHDDFGEAVVAVVVASTEPCELAALNAQLQDTLARFKQPKAVVNVAELPRNTMGKVQKNLLRDRFADLFAS